MNIQIFSKNNHSISREPVRTINQGLSLNLRLAKTWCVEVDRMQLYIWAKLLQRLSGSGCIRSNRHWTYKVLEGLNAGRNQKKTTTGFMSVK